MDEIKDKIILAVKKAITNRAEVVDCYHDIMEIDCNDVDYIAEQVADALIAARLRFTFTSDFASDTQKAYKEGYLKGKEESEAEIELAKAFHEEKCAEWELACYKLQKAEHRAEVAEKALKNALNNDTCYLCNEKIPCRCEHRDWGSDECIKSLLQQAEKELEGEKK